MCIAFLISSIAWRASLFPCSRVSCICCKDIPCASINLPNAALSSSGVFPNFAANSFNLSSMLGGVSGAERMSRLRFQLPLYWWCPPFRFPSQQKVVPFADGGGGTCGDDGEVTSEIINWILYNLCTLKNENVLGNLLFKLSSLTLCFWLAQ